MSIFTLAGDFGYLKFLCNSVVNAIHAHYGSVWFHADKVVTLECET